MNPIEQQLVEAVQTNCHIADAAHAADMTLCIYLLQMREFYRWEQGIAPLATIPREAVGPWLTARETLWSSLEGQPWRRLPLAGVEFDPFEVDAINAVLVPRGWVYGAGYTAPGRPSFFLAELLSEQRRDGLALYLCGREHARGLASPPAALMNGAIFLRQEALRRWLWEKYEGWTLRRPAGAFHAALLAQGYAQDGTGALERMVQSQTETLILHELGEARAGEWLGPAWQELRAALDDRRADLQLRAVRDLLADCLVTLPVLLERGDDASLHFWFAGFDGLREALFPRLAQAYDAWCAGHGGDALRQAVVDGERHWRQVCSQVLDACRAPEPGGKALVDRLLAPAACALA